jgi:deoxyadenosine/deoxycytidine kinase
MQDYIQETLMQLLTEIDNLKKTSRYQLIDDGINQAIEVVRKKMEEVQEKEKKTVCIAGPIGAGKTYFCNKIKELFLDIKVFNKVIKKRDKLIELYYGNKMDWTPAFQAISFFSKFSNLINANNQDGISVLERDIEDNYKIFALAQHQEGFSDEDDWEHYTTVADYVLEKIQQPSCYVYLKATAPYLYKNVNRRNRAGENKITLSYLQDINRRYNLWIKELIDRGEKVITIQVDHDFSDEEIKEVFSEIFNDMKKGE